MEFLYEKILERLQAIPELKWIDLDHGQLDYYEHRPSVSFPCALIGLQISKAEDLGAKKQTCQAIVNIRLGFDFTGNTNAVTSKPQREKSMHYFKVANEVYKALQGFKDENINSLSRMNLREEKRNDHYKVINIPFSTAFNDYSSYES